MPHAAQELRVVVDPLRVPPSGVRHGNGEGRRPLASGRRRRAMAAERDAEWRHEGAVALWRAGLR